MFPSVVTGKRYVILSPSSRAKRLSKSCWILYWGEFTVKEVTSLELNHWTGIWLVLFETPALFELQPHCSIWRHPRFSLTTVYESLSHRGGGAAIRGGELSKLLCYFFKRFILFHFKLWSMSKNIFFFQLNYNFLLKKCLFHRRNLVAKGQNVTVITNRILLCSQLFALNLTELFCKRCELMWPIVSDYRPHTRKLVALWLGYYRKCIVSNCSQNQCQQNVLEKPQKYIFNFSCSQIWPPTVETYP